MTETKFPSIEERLYKLNGTMMNVRKEINTVGEELKNMNERIDIMLDNADIE